MPVELKIRNIQTGEAQVAQFDNIKDAETWLRERPRFVDVLGPPRHGAIDPKDEVRLRDAMRPLDDEEKAAQASQDKRDADAMRDMLAKEQQRMKEQIAARQDEMRNADPNRIMHVAWERGKGTHNAEAGDDRPVPAIATKAVEAWVKERDSWVHPRGQYVIDAVVAVWPGPVPSGNEDDRVEPGGRFNVLAGTAPELN